MSTLTDFLTARIGEDEAVARDAVGTAAFQQQTGRWSFEHVEARYGSIPVVFAIGNAGGKTQAALMSTAWESEERGAHIARHDPARVLAECEAKRRIVESCAGIIADENGYFQALNVPEAAAIAEHHLRLLALPHSDHPDFRPEWRV